MNEDVFEGGDPFDEPAWKQAKPRGNRPMIGCRLSWFEWVLPLVKSKGQLAFVLLLYRRCCICRSATVTAPTDVFESLSISRFGKRRFLLALEQLGIVRIEATKNGEIGKITLLNWPEPA